MRLARVQLRANPSTSMESAALLPCCFRMLMAARGPTRREEAGGSTHQKGFGSCGEETRGRRPLAGAIRVVYFFCARSPEVKQKRADLLFKNPTSFL